MKRFLLTLCSILKVAQCQTFEPDPPVFSIKVTNISATIGESYTENVVNDLELELHYDGVVGEGLRVLSEVIEGDVSPDFPVTITVLSDRNSISWHLPFKEESVVINSAGRTLCFENLQSTVNLVISVKSRLQCKVNLTLIKEEHFGTSIGKSGRVSKVPMGSPVYHFVDVTGVDTDAYVKVHVSSPDEFICGLISVQPRHCPLSNELIGDWQTILKLAAFTIKPKHYPDGFYLAFTTFANNVKCGNYTQPQGSQEKSFHYKITQPLTKINLYAEVLLTFLVTIAIALGMAIGSICYFQKVFVAGQPIGSVEPTDEVDGVSTSKVLKKLNTVEIKGMYKQCHLYVWMVVLMTVFYGLPALQIVLSNQKTLEDTGNHDLCYFNFLCKVQLGKVHGFNQVLSNIGYGIFGFTFLLLVKYRQRQHTKMMLENQEPKGIPQHFGLFYALGLALISEGFFSACYHVCPTERNFQFDTTFMYIIAILSFVKIYQFRHPEANSDAPILFFGIGIIMFVEVCGIFFDNTLFWTLSLIFYFVSMLTLSPVVYLAGRCCSYSDLNLDKLKSTWQIMSTEPVQKRRAFFILLWNMFNIALLIFGACKTPKISDYILLILIGNLFMYFLYYIVMKMRQKESISKLAKAIAIIQIILWMLAGYYFVNKTKTTRVTPAQSRNMNQECTLGNLFDGHDIWHFISAAGLFFHFVLLLIIDDGISQNPRAEINVF